MNSSELKKLFNSVSDNDSLILLQVLSSNSGFFKSAGKLAYVSKDIYTYKTESIDTEYLKLITHIEISAINTNHTFPDGYYNVIQFKGEISDNNIESFTNLCKVYSQNEIELDFRDFFFSLIDIFQLPSEQSYKNCIGLFGELIFIKTVFDKYSIDLSPFWHKDGMYSKYDLSCASKNIEIKTSTNSDGHITLKHEQLFNDNIHNNLLVFIECNYSEQGQSIIELLEEMKKEKNAFKSLNFSINAAKELSRINTIDANKKKIEVADISVYYCEDIVPFKEIPSCVSNLTYELDVSDSISLSDIEMNNCYLTFN